MWSSLLLPPPTISHRPTIFQPRHHRLRFATRRRGNRPLIPRLRRNILRPRDRLLPNAPQLNLPRRNRLMPSRQRNTGSCSKRRVRLLLLLRHLLPRIRRLMSRLTCCIGTNLLFYIFKARINLQKQLSHSLIVVVVVVEELSRRRSRSMRRLRMRVGSSSRSLPFVVVIGTG